MNYLISMEEIGPISLAFFLIILNGGFVAAEFAIARVRKTQIDRIAAPGADGSQNKTAKMLQGILGNINDYVAACQIGITIASLYLGVMTEASIAKLIEPLLMNLNLGDNVHIISITLSISIITFLHVFLGEMIPKNLALIDPVRSSLALTWFLAITYALFKIPVVVLNYSSEVALRLFGIESVFKETVHTEDELKMILSSSQEEGILEEEEEEMIQSIFDFNDTVAKDIMTPRTDMFYMEESIIIKDALKDILDSGYSRFPIINQRLDNITGYVTIKDMMLAYQENRENESLETIKTDIPKFPDGMYVIDLMKELQAAKKQIAVLIDEFGGTSGLVTVEDIVEEIFGEIHDEHEREEIQPIEKVKSNEYLIDGLVTLREVNEELGLV